MEEILEKLYKYFNKSEVENLLVNFKNKQRANIINNKFFAKIGKNIDKLFFDNLIKEREIYINNSENQHLPKMIDSYNDNNYCLIILERINGQTIGKKRNEFNLKLNQNQRKNIINSVLNIKKITINGNLDNSYNRKERLEKYLEASKIFISKITYNKINKIKDIIINEKYDRVVSHSDLISTNIIMDGDRIFFIDWEFISYKPQFYDLIYFLLFSKVNNSIDILYKYNFDVDIQETLKDGIILCLKEIQNNAKLIGKIDEKIINKNIDRWKKELNNILRRF